MTSVQKKKEDDYLNLKEKEEDAEKRLERGKEGGVLGGARGRR